MVINNTGLRFRPFFLAIFRFRPFFLAFFRIWSSNSDLCGVLLNNIVPPTIEVQFIIHELMVAWLLPTSNLSPLSLWILKANPLWNFSFYQCQWSKKRRMFNFLQISTQSICIYAVHRCSINIYIYIMLNSVARLNW